MLCNCINIYIHIILYNFVFIYIYTYTYTVYILNFARRHLDLIRAPALRAARPSPAICAALHGHGG